MTLDTELNAALSEVRGGRPEAARRRLGSVLTQFPSAADAWRLSAIAARMCGDLAAAEEHLRESVRLAPANPEAWNTLGLVLDDLGRPDDAVDAFERALSLKPDFEPAAINLSRVKLRTGDATGAADAVERFDRSPQALLVRANALRGLERVGEAAGLYTALLNADRSNYRAAHGLGLAFLDLGRPEDALKVLDPLAAGGLAEAHYPRFAALARLKRLDEAFDAAEAALTADPTNAAALHGYAQLLYMTGAPEKIAPMFEDRLVRAGHAAAVYASFLDVLVEMGDYARARDVASRAEARFGATGWLVTRRIGIEVEAGRGDAAAGAADRAAERGAGEDLALAANMARAYLMAGRPHDAGPVIEAAVSCAPGDRFWTAMVATHARAVGDAAAYDALVDMQTMVRTRRLEPPASYNGLAAFNDELAKALRGLHEYAAEPLGQSLRGGAQTPTDLRHCKLPVVRDFFAMVERAFADYRSALTPSADHPLLGAIPDRFALEGAWSVKLGAGGRHVNHVHPEGWASSVYYVDVPPQVSGSPDREGWLKFGEPPFEVPGLEPHDFVEPRAGELTLFPSYLWHGTVPIKRGERLTIAFDISPARRGAR